MAKRKTRRVATVQIGRCAITGKFLPLAVARKRKKTAIIQTVRRVRDYSTRA